MSEDRSPEEEWAVIFEVFGREALRTPLYDVATSLYDGVDDNRVIEFEDMGDHAQAVDITDHHEVLEEKVNNQGPTNMLDSKVNDT